MKLIVAQKSTARRPNKSFFYVSLTNFTLKDFLKAVFRQLNSSLKAFIFLLKHISGVKIIHKIWEPCYQWF